MLLDNKKKGLRDLLKARGLGSKDASGSQPPHMPPLLLLLSMFLPQLA